MLGTCALLLHTSHSQHLVLLCKLWNIYVVTATQLVSLLAEAGMGCSKPCPTATPSHFESLTMLSCC